MRLLLVRHGETDSNVARELDTGYPGAPLNPAGRSQAEALVGALADEPIDAVYSSDLGRAQETAAPLAAARGLTVVVSAGFREIFAGSHDMSTDWKPYIDMMVGWADDPSSALEGAESFVDFHGRWGKALAEVEAAGHGCVAVVSHGAAMRIWAPFAATNLTAADAAAWPLPNTAVIALEGSSADGWRVASWAGVDVAS